MSGIRLTVDDICRDFGLCRSELVNVVAQDEITMTLLLQECKPVLFNTIDREVRELTDKVSPFHSISSSLSQRSSARSPGHASQRASSVTDRSQTIERASVEGTTSASPSSSGSDTAQSKEIDPDSPEVLTTLLSTMETQAPTLNAVAKAVTKYDSNFRVGPLVGGIATLLRCRNVLCDGLARSMGLFMACNGDSKQFDVLFDRLGYAIPYRVARPLARELVRQGKTGLFSRHSLRRMDRFLAHFEGDLSGKGAEGGSQQAVLAPPHISGLVTRGRRARRKPAATEERATKQRKLAISDEGDETYQSRT